MTKYIQKSMKQVVVIIFSLISQLALAQNKSIIKHINSDSSKFEVTQKSTDSGQVSTIDSIEGKGINIKVAQGGSDSTGTQKNANGFRQWMTGSKSVFEWIVAFGAAITIIWGGISFFKRPRNRR